MNRPLRKVTLEVVQTSTGWMIERVEKYKAAVADPRKAERLAAQECVVCFYVDDKIGGAAMTTSQCGYCETELHFGSTCVDRLCPTCAKNLKLCQHCASTIDLKQRRKL